MSQKTKHLTAISKVTGNELVTCEELCQMLNNINGIAKVEGNELLTFGTTELCAGHEAHFAKRALNVMFDTNPEQYQVHRTLHGASKTLHENNLVSKSNTYYITLFPCHGTSILN